MYRKSSQVLDRPNVFIKRLLCQVLRSPTRYTLGSMVSHFQKLFDVTSLSGVYPRMNEVYARLGEMTNTMTNVRHILDLGNCNPGWKGSVHIQVLCVCQELCTTTPLHLF